MSTYRYKERMQPYLLLVIYCSHVYLFLDLFLAFIAKIATGLLGLELEPQFDNPFCTTSLQDFWGHRWNLMVSANLRPSVYDLAHTRWGVDAGILAAFLVSDLMHELMVYYLISALPTREVTAFFVLHGLLTVAERKSQKAGWWRPHPVMVVLLSVGFVITTVYWLFFPTLLRGGVVALGLAECSAVMGYVEGFGGSLLGRLGLL